MVRFKVSNANRYIIGPSLLVPGLFSKDTSLDIHDFEYVPNKAVNFAVWNLNLPISHSPYYIHILAL